MNFKSFASQKLVTLHRIPLVQIKLLTTPGSENRGATRVYRRSRLQESRTVFSRM